MKRATLLLNLIWAVGCTRPIEGTGGTVGPQPLGASCTFDGTGAAAARPVLAAMVGTDVLLVTGSGSVRAVYRLADGAGVAPERVNAYGVVARGGSIATSGEWSPNGTGQPDDVVSEVVLLDADGAVRFSRRWQGYLNQGAQLDVSGVLTFATSDAAWVVTRDGVARRLVGWWALGGPEAGGALPVSSLGGDGRAGWLDGAGRFSALAVPFPGGTGQAAWNGARQVYLGDAGGAAVVVAERPGDVLRASLPLGIAPGSVGIEVGQQRYAALRWSGEIGVQRMWRFDTATGELVELSLAPPPGLRPFADFRTPILDDQGALILALRDDYRGALYRSDDGGATFARLGLTVADVLALGSSARGGSYVIEATNGVYGGETQWAAPPPGEMPDLDGQSLQLARPGGPSYQLPVLGAQEVALSADGGCAAWWQTDGQQAPSLHSLEVASGARVTVMNASGGYPTAAWIE